MRVLRAPIINLAVCSKIHVAGGARRGHFAKINRERFTLACKMNNHKTAAANIARLRMRNSKRKACRDGGVNGITAARQNISPDLGREAVLRADYAVLGNNGVKTRIVAHHRVRACRICVFGMAVLRGRN